MQYPWIVSLKCLDHVLEYSFAPKFLWQMVLKQSPVTAFPFDKGKEGGKGVSSEFHTRVERFMLILNLERKKKKWVKH